MRKALFIILLASLSRFSYSQYNWDFGGGIGVSNHLCDIGGYDGKSRPFVLDMKLEVTSYSFNGFVRRRLMDDLFLNLGFSYGKLEGADSLSLYPERRSRNLSFRNNIMELSLRAEYPLYKVYDVGKTGRYVLDHKTYAFLGVAGFKHNPQALHKNGTWYDLRPLMTEGQNSNYSLYQFAIPMGAGFYFTYKKMHRFGFEMGWRLTFTDYIDDVSTIYPDNSELGEPREIAQELSNRYSEGAKTLTDSSQYKPGSLRGLSEPGAKPKNDSYVFAFVTYSYVIKGKYKNQRFRPTKNFAGLGSMKRKKRKTRAKF